MYRYSRFLCLVSALLFLNFFRLGAQVNIASAGKKSQNSKGQIDITIGQIDYGNSRLENYFYLEGLQQPFALHAARLDSLLCADAVFSPANPAEGQYYSGSLSIPYLGGNYLQVNAVSFSSSVVTGLEASLPETTLNPADGTLVFQVQGTPSVGGEAAFDIVVADKVCTIPLIVIPQTIELPAFFSPNGDGMNDLWGSPLLEAKYPGSKIYIFDRFGKLVAQMNALQNWNGQLDGVDLPAGIYWYMVETPSKKDQLTGSITLMR